MSFYRGHVLLFTQLFSHLTKSVSLTISKIPIVALLILDTLYIDIEWLCHVLRMYLQSNQIINTSKLIKQLSFAK